MNKPKLFRACSACRGEGIVPMKDDCGWWVCGCGADLIPFEPNYRAAYKELSNEMGLSDVIRMVDAACWVSDDEAS